MEGTIIFQDYMPLAKKLYEESHKEGKVFPKWEANLNNEYFVQSWIEIARQSNNKLLNLERAMNDVVVCSIPSLNPDDYENLLDIFERLAKTRKIRWIKP